MIARGSLCLVAVLLAGCTTSGQQNPLRTAEGRQEAVSAYIQLGIGYLQQGSTESAKAPLSEALKLDASNADAHVALALVYQTELEPKLAEEHYRKALSQRKGDPRILNNYGSFLFEQERYAEAYERFQEAGADPMYGERSRVFENLGLTALKLNQREQAREHFIRATRLNRNQPRSFFELAQMYYADGDYVSARSYYQWFSNIAEQNAASLLLGVRLANVFEQRDQAASLGLQLRRLYPGTAEYKQYLSEQK